MIHTQTAPLNIYTWKKVREHPKFFLIISRGKNQNIYVIRMNCCTYTMNGVRLKAADTASDLGNVEVISA